MSRWVVLILAFPALAVLKGLHAAAAVHNPSSEGICGDNKQNSSNDIASDGSAWLQLTGRNSIDYLDHGFAEARRRVEELKHHVEDADYPNFPYLVKIVRDPPLQRKVRCQGSIISNDKDAQRTWVVTTAACFRDGINFHREAENSVVWMADLPTGWTNTKFYIKRYDGPGGQAESVIADTAYSFRPRQNPRQENSDIVLLRAPGVLSKGVPISRNDLTKTGRYDFSAWKLQGSFTKRAFIESWKLHGAATEQNYLTDLSAEDNVDLSCVRDSLDDTGSPGMRRQGVAGDYNPNSYDEVGLHFVYYYTACRSRSNKPDEPKQKKFVAIAIQKGLPEICRVCGGCNTACKMLPEEEEQSVLSFSVESGNNPLFPRTQLNLGSSKDSTGSLWFSQKDLQEMERSNDERPEEEK